MSFLLLPTKTVRIIGLSAATLLCIFISVQIFIEVFYFDKSNVRSSCLLFFYDDVSSKRLQNIRDKIQNVSGLGLSDSKFLADITQEMALLYNPHPSKGTCVNEWPHMAAQIYAADTDVLVASPNKIFNKANDVFINPVFTENLSLDEIKVKFGENFNVFYAKVSNLNASGTWYEIYRTHWGWKENVVENTSFIDQFFFQPNQKDLLVSYGDLIKFKGNNLVAISGVESKTSTTGNLYGFVKKNISNYRHLDLSVIHHKTWFYFPQGSYWQPLDLNTFKIAGVNERLLNMYLDNKFYEQLRHNHNEVYKITQNLNKVTTLHMNYQYNILWKLFKK